MAAKSVLKSSASALLALAISLAMLSPAAAQERPDRGERGTGRMERSSPQSMPRPVERSFPQAMPRAPSQAPSWQSRGPSASAQPGWGGRPMVSGGSQPPRSSNSGPSNPGSWNGRPAWQGGGADRERGDRGNGVNPAGQPAFGRPAWQGGTSVQSGGTRNPTYVDPSRGNTAGRNSDGRNWDGRGNEGRGAGGRGGDNTNRPGTNGTGWSRDGNGQWAQGNGSNWRQDARGQWQRERERDRARDGRDRDDNRRWNRDARGNNDWRGNNGWNNNGWNNNRWGYSNGWRGNGWSNNGWGYNNGWRSWDRDGWRRDNRYDWYGWRNRHRSTFSLGLYYAPWQDYSYSRFDIGVVIGAPFYDQRYWITDPYAYRLPPADGPYRWVRYYNDALLVDIYSGEVVDAIYDVFY